MFRILPSLLSFIVVFCISDSTSLSAQEESAGQLVNGKMEDSTGNAPKGWRFASPSGNATISLETDEPFEGKQSALLDALNANVGRGGMTANVVQSIDGRPWRGKRIRFRAAVRTSDLEDSAGAQLWFRVDREPRKDQPVFGAFDNMGDRPIRSDKWKHYDIVLQVNDEAEKLIFGMFLTGSGKAWLDDVTLEEVDSETPTTGTNIGTSNKNKAKKDTEKKVKSKRSQSSSRFQMSPILMKAMAEAENAPQQSFFSHWMWLALIAIVLFCLSATPAKEIEFENRQKQLVRKHAMSFVPKFSLRFSVVY